MTLDSALERFEEAVRREAARRQIIREQIKGIEEELSSLKEREDTLRQAGRILLLAAEEARESARIMMERIVTNALRSVFPGDLTFHIDIETKGERSEAVFAVSSTYGGGLTVRNEPKEARGGGIVDIISLALRVAMLESVYPPIEGPLVLDEPAKHVSEEYTQGVAEFIDKLEEAFGRQIILITHNQDLAAVGARSYLFAMQSGRTEVRPAGTLAYEGF